MSDFVTILGLTLGCLPRGRAGRGAVCCTPCAGRSLRYQLTIATLCRWSP